MQGNSGTWNFTYDASGLRTGRNTLTTQYRYWYNDSGLLLRMEKGNTVYSFTYDPAGRPVSVTEGNTRYYYVLNQQGDVVAIINGNGDFVVEYYYDAWGRLLSATGTLATTLGVNNPLRYRGYVYDTETGLYYLQSRYYNPEMGRFINADDPGYMGVDGTPSSYNLFSYCGNNPVICADPEGKFGHILIGGFFGALFNTAAEFTSQFANYLRTGEAIDWGDIGTSACSGFVYGTVMTATGSDTLASMASTATASVINGVRNGESLGNIIWQTTGDTLKTAAFRLAPKMINKSLSGKFQKLNSVQKIVKKLTDPPSQGKFSSGRDYMSEALYYSHKRAKNKAIINILGNVCEHVHDVLF